MLNVNNTVFMAYFSRNLESITVISCPRTVSTLDEKLTNRLLGLSGIAW
jgi:hypothetical protein